MQRLVILLAIAIALPLSTPVHGDDGDPRPIWHPSMLPFPRLGLGDVLLGIINIEWEIALDVPASRFPEKLDLTSRHTADCGFESTLVPLPHYATAGSIAASRQMASKASPSASPSPRARATVRNRPCPSVSAPRGSSSGNLRQVRRD